MHLVALLKTALLATEKKLILHALIGSISLLNLSYSKLIVQLLETRWIADRDLEIVRLYSIFLENLVSAHATYCKPVAAMLISFLRKGKFSTVIIIVS